jgi:hypothetical protein
LLGGIGLNGGGIPLKRGLEVLGFVTKTEEGCGSLEKRGTHAEKEIWGI